MLRGIFRDAVRGCAPNGEKKFDEPGLFGRGLRGILGNVRR